MHVFKYKGYDGNGQKVDGEISADSLDEAERRLAGQSVSIISIIPAGMKKGGGKSAAAESGPSPGLSLFGKKKASDADLAIILRDLAVMAESGVPFVEALDAVVLSARTKTIEKSLKLLRDEIVGGKGLASAMRSANSLFPSIVCDLVKVAEEGGRLDKALASAAQYVERSADLRKKVMNAMLYPIVLSVIAFLTMTILVVFVLPKFSDIFTKMGADVPVTTQVMIHAGKLIRDNPLYAGIGFVVLLIALKLLWSLPAVSRFVSLWSLKVPGVGELMKKLALSRAFQSISTLLSSNVAVMQALEHGAKVAGNPVISDALVRTRTSVEHGGSLSESLSETRVFPTTLVQMVAVGERTGRLGQLMANTAAHMEQDVDARLKALVSIVEPIMIVVMGGIVGLITLSIIIPIYSVIENIK